MLIFYFAVSAAITFTMPVSDLVTLLGHKVGNEVVENYGFLFVFVSSILGMGWIPVSLFVACRLFRREEKITSRMNVGALTAAAHCLYYALLGVGCSIWNNLVLRGHLPNDLADPDLLFIGLSVTYLLGLAAANALQANAFWPKRHA